MKTHVPDMHTDFAYSAAAEEYGLWLSLVIIALFAILVIRGLYKAMKLNDPFEQVAASTLFVLVGMQAFINVAVNLALVPATALARISVNSPSILLSRGMPSATFCRARLQISSLPYRARTWAEWHGNTECSGKTNTRSTAI